MIRERIWPMTKLINGKTSRIMETIIMVYGITTAVILGIFFFLR